MARDHAGGDSGRKPRKHKVPAARKHSYPVAQPFQPPNGAAGQPPSADAFPPWFWPLAKGVGLLTLAMACTLTGWLVFRAPSKKAVPSAVALADSKNQPEAAAPKTSPRTDDVKAAPKEGKTAEPKKEEPPKAKKQPMEPPVVQEKTAEPGKSEPKPKSEPTPRPETPKTDTKTADVTFNQHVLPILKTKCFACHGSTGKKKAGLDVGSVASLLKGGDNGAALTPGSLEKSLLWESIASDQMPPGKTKLSQAEKKTIQTWITMGKDIVK